MRGLLEQASDLRPEYQSDYPADFARPVVRGLLAHPDPIENLRMSLPALPTPGGQELTNPDPDVVEGVPNPIGDA